MQKIFEQWGALVVRRPWAVLLVSLAVVVAGAVGLSRLTTANHPTQIFVSASPAYARYEAMRALFPPSQNDAILLLSDENLLTPDHLEALRSLHLDLSLEDGVDGVVSLFSARNVAEGGAAFPPLVPNEMPQGAAFETLAAEIVAHPLIRNRLISTDGTTAVFNIGLDLEGKGRAEIKKIVAGLRTTVEAALAPYDITPLLTGAPVMRAEMDAINAREEIFLSVAGLVIGGLVIFLFFRRLSFAILAGTVPAASIIVTFGLLGWLDIPRSIALQIVAPLIIVIAFNNAMHLLFAMLHSRADPHAAATPVIDAVGHVGPASLMTSLTSAIAFSALTFTESEVIRTFGAFAALGTLAAFLAVITLIPALVVLVPRILDGRKQAATQDRSEALSVLCTRIDTGARRRPRIIMASAVILFALFAYAQTTLTPNYRFVDNVPLASETRAALAAIDDAFGGSQPLRVLVRWPAGDAAAEAAVVGHLAELETRLAAHPEIGSVLSVATLRDWVAAQAPATAGDLDTLLKALPESLHKHLIDREAGAALVNAMVPDQTTEQSRQLVSEVTAILDDIAAEAPGMSFDVTGTVALTAVETGRIIESLQVGLLVAILLIITLIGFTFGHIWPATISVLPNIFPLVAGAAFLAARGGEINFAGAIAMTVAFGIAVDDTIHMLYRFRREQKRLGNSELALERTVARVGPVIVMSTLVLIAGISVLLLSEMPMNRDYGMLTIVIFIAALIGDLIFLPALIRVYLVRISRTEGVAVPGQPETPATG